MVGWRLEKLMMSSAVRGRAEDGCILGKRSIEDLEKETACVARTSSLILWAARVV